MGPGRVGGRLDGFSELRLFGGFVSVVVESCSTKCKLNNGIDHLCVWSPLFVDVVVSRSPEIPLVLASIHNSYRWGQRQAIEPQERST